MKRIITLFFFLSSCCALTLAQSTPFKLSKSEKKQGFKVLFDGTSLEQWSSNSKDYKLEDGCIVVTPTLEQGGNFYTKQTFSDFILRFEFKLTPAANNGLGIRHKFVDAPTGYDGMELQIIDSEAPVYKDLKPYQYHGSLYGLAPAKRGFQKPAGEWNRQEVIANGTSIKVILNGKVILDVDLDEFAKQNPDIKIPAPVLYPSGHIAFLGHGDVVYFRNIRIKDNGKGLSATDAKVKPLNILLDTDMASDIDDAGMFATVLSLAKKGFADIKAVGYCVANPSAMSAEGVGAMDAIAAYYGFPNLNIGVLKPFEGMPEQVHTSKYVQQVRAHYVNRFRGKDAVIPDAVKVYRKALTELPDAAKNDGAVFITVGMLTNVWRLMLSQPDEISPLTGIELMNKKIGKIVSMAGNMTVPGGAPEFNLIADLAGVQYVLQNWQKELDFCPVDMVLGTHSIANGGTLLEKEGFSNPVTYAYYLHCGGVSSTSFDLVTAYYAICGEYHHENSAKRLFDKGEQGFIKMDHESKIQFTPDKNGKHYIIKNHAPDAEIQLAIENLLYKR